MAFRRGAIIGPVWRRRRGRSRASTANGAVHARHLTPFAVDATLLKQGSFFTTVSINEKFAAIRKGLLEFLILRIVSSDKVYVADMLQRLSGTEFATQEGTLYPLLSKLRRDGLVDYEWQESEVGPAAQVLPPHREGQDPPWRTRPSTGKPSTPRSRSWDDNHAESRHRQSERHRLSPRRDRLRRTAAPIWTRAEAQLRDNPDRARDRRRPRTGDCREVRPLSRREQERRHRHRGHGDDLDEMGPVHDDTTAAAHASTDSADAASTAGGASTDSSEPGTYRSATSTQDGFTPPRQPGACI